MTRLLIILFLASFCRVTAMETLPQVNLGLKLTELKESLATLKNKLGATQKKLELLKEKLNTLERPSKIELDNFDTALKTRGEIGVYSENVVFTFLKEKKIQKQPALIWLINQILRSPNKYQTKHLQDVLEKIHQTRIAEILGLKYKNQSIPEYLVNEITKPQQTLDIITSKAILTIILDAILKSNNKDFIQACLNKMLEATINNMFINFSIAIFDDQFQIFDQVLRKTVTNKPMLKDSLAINVIRLLDSVDPKYKDQKDKLKSFLD